MNDCQTTELDHVIPTTVTLVWISFSGFILLMVTIAGAMTAYKKTNSRHKQNLNNIDLSDVPNGINPESIMLSIHDTNTRNQSKIKSPIGSQFRLNKNHAGDWGSDIEIIMNNSNDRTTVSNAKAQRRAKIAPKMTRKQKQHEQQVEKQKREARIARQCVGIGLIIVGIMLQIGFALLQVPVGSVIGSILVICGCCSCCYDCCGYCCSCCLCEDPDDEHNISDPNKTADSHSNASRWRSAPRFELEPRVEQMMNVNLKAIMLTVTDGKKKNYKNKNENKETDKEEEKNVEEQQEEEEKHSNKHFDWSRFCKRLPTEILRKKRCYFPIATHIVDQGTDVGVILEFYQIYYYQTVCNYDNNDGENYYPVNGRLLFYLSILAFIGYRIISSIWILMETNSRCHTLLQLFDLKLFDALYINFKLNKRDPTTAQRYIQILEASLESFWQMVIQFYYVIKTDLRLNNSNWFIYFSLIASVVNISSKMTSEDKIYFVSQWRNIEYNYKLCPCQCINWFFVTRSCLRLADIILRACIVLALWISIGGIQAAIYVAFEFVCLIIAAIVTQNLSIIIWICQTPFQSSDYFFHPKVKRLCMQRCCNNIVCNSSIAHLLSELYHLFLSLLCCLIFCGGYKLNTSYVVLFVYRFASHIAIGIIIIIVRANDAGIGALILFLNWIVFRGISGLHEYDAIIKLPISVDRGVRHLIDLDRFEEIEELKMFGYNIRESHYNRRDVNGETPITRTNNLKLKVGSNNNNTRQIQLKFRQAKMDRIEFLLSKKANINDYNGDKYGYTILAQLVFEGDFKFVKFLCQKSTQYNQTIDMDVKSGFGKSSLTYAALLDELEIFLYLLNYSIWSKKSGNIAAKKKVNQMLRFDDAHKHINHTNLDVIRQILGQQGIWEAAIASANSTRKINSQSGNTYCKNKVLKYLVANNLCVISEQIPMISTYPTFNPNNIKVVHNKDNQNYTPHEQEVYQHISNILTYSTVKYDKNTTDLESLRKRFLYTILESPHGNINPKITFQAIDDISVRIGDDNNWCRLYSKNEQSLLKKHIDEYIKSKMASSNTAKNDDVNKYQYMPLFYLVKQMNYGLVKFALENCYNHYEQYINDTNEEGHSLLMMAIKHAISNSGDLNVSYLQQTLQLQHDFDKQSKISIVKLLLKQKNIDVNYIVNDEFTPLMLSVIINKEIEIDIEIRSKIVQMLIDDKKTNINQQTPKLGWNALIHAINQNDWNIVKMLIDCPRTNVNLSTISGDTCMTLACAWGRVQIVQILLSSSDNDGDSDISESYEPFHLVNSYDENKEHEYVYDDYTMSKKIDLKHQNNDGNTALMATCTSVSKFNVAHDNALKIIQMLLKQGAVIETVNKWNHKGQTALDLAIESGFTDAIQQLKLLLNYNR